jgi:membrane protease YdiL (CAAX protease family)
MSEIVLEGGVPPVLPGAVSRGRWWIHLLLLTIFPLGSAVLSVGASAQKGPALGHTAMGVLIVSGLNLVIFAGLFALAWVASRATVDDLLWRWRPGWWVVPLGVGYSVALRILVAVVAIIILAVVALVLVATHMKSPEQLRQFVLANRAQVENLVDISALRNNPAYFWLTLTLVSFGLGGLREEIWRSGLLAGLAKLWPRMFGSRWGQIGGAAFAAVLFGLGHAVQGAGAVCLTALLGFGLGVIMVVHRSIWPAVIAHGVFDATSLGLLPWVMEEMKKVN